MKHVLHWFCLTILENADVSTSNSYTSADAINNTYQQLLFIVKVSVLMLTLRGTIHALIYNSVEYMLPNRITQPHTTFFIGLDIKSRIVNVVFLL